MATTVSYKNNTLTTIDYNDSATLTTQGTWLEDNITIDVDALNLQSKTVTPTTSQQVITPDVSQIASNLNKVSMPGGVNTSGVRSAAHGMDLSALIDGHTYHIQMTITESIPAGTTFEEQDYIVDNNYTFLDDYFSISLSSMPVYWSNLRIGLINYYATKSTTGDYHLSFSNCIITDPYTTSYDGLSQVTVNAIPSNYVVPTGTKTITQNGTGIDVASYAAVDVAVDGSQSINLQSKTNINPTTSSQTITADNGYDGLSSVQINAMPSGSATAPASISGSSASITTGTNTITLSKTVSVTPSVSAGYVSSGTAGNSSVSLTASVTVNPTPTASSATVTIPAGYYSSQTTKSVSTTTHPNPTASINSSTGLVTASHTQTAGYVSAGTTTGTLQLTTQAAATITPTTSSQTAVAAGRYTTGAVTVAAIPSNYVDSSTLQTYYTGSSAPSSSLGSNGDLYFQTTGGQ